MNEYTVILHHRHKTTRFVGFNRCFSGNLGLGFDKRQRYFKGIIEYIMCYMFGLIKLPLTISALEFDTLGCGFCIEGGGGLRHHRSRKTNRARILARKERRETEEEVDHSEGFFAESEKEEGVSDRDWIPSRYICFMMIRDLREYGP